MQPPKVFFSYSWTSVEYRQYMADLADRLLSEGVDVVIDQYDLKEGHDVISFMEKIKHNETIGRVLILSDKEYMRKANARKSGVGAETQIISKEVYESVDQEKFIPIVMEVDDKKAAYLPTYLATRMYIDFSSPQKVNENWERLVRLLHGKPLRPKPKIGSPPAFLEEQNTGNFVNARTALNNLVID